MSMSTDLEPCRRTAPPQPGRGANLITLGGGQRYAYAALSRRAGGTSLGVDLTPTQECSLACVYCQVPRKRPSRGRPTIDPATLRSELTSMLRSAPASGWADLCIAGSGEPTMLTNLEAALVQILNATAEASFDRPMRLYTNGLHLGKKTVRHALAEWTNRSGEVWVKLDALSQEMCAKLWRRQIAPATHVARIWDFALEQPVGIQTMMMSGEGMVGPETLARQLVSVISWGLSLGAKFRGVQLVAPTRPAGDPAVVRAAHLVPASREEMLAAARILEAELPLPIQVFA